VRMAGQFAAKATALARYDDAVRLVGDTVTFDESFLSWICPADAAALPLADGSFDICFSNATFEHVREVERAVQESVRVLRPGGYGIHQIDLRDHRDFDKPLAFLCEDKAAWERIFRESKEAEYTNRWRVHEFVEAFRRTGAEIVTATSTWFADDLEDLRPRLATEFKDLRDEDLLALDAFLVVRKSEESSVAPGHR